MRLPSTFREELESVESLLDDAEKRLGSLKEYAEFEELPRDVVRRLGNKARAVAVTNDALKGIPALVGGEAPR